MRPTDSNLDMSFTYDIGDYHFGSQMFVYILYVYLFLYAFCLYCIMFP